MKDVNVVTLVCRLTRDPELRSTPSGTSVCSLRVAFSTSWKNGDTWEDRSNYADVTVWGAQGETVARHMTKGRQICVLGRLQWREWEDKQGGGKRQALDIVADQVQFLSDGSGGGGDGGSRFTPQSDIPVDPPAASLPSSGDDDIPF